MPTRDILNSPISEQYVNETTPLARALTILEASEQVRRSKMKGAGAGMRQGWRGQEGANGVEVTHPGLHANAGTKKARARGRGIQSHYLPDFLLSIRGWALGLGYRALPASFSSAHTRASEPPDKPGYPMFKAWPFFRLWPFPVRAKDERRAPSFTQSFRRFSFPRCVPRFPPAGRSCHASASGTDAGAAARNIQ